MSQKQKIYILRHGETDYNRQMIIQGRGVDSSLNETGREQALQFYQTYRHIPFDVVICSSQRRSLETIQPFLSENRRVERFPELDEIHWGVHEGKRATPLLHAEYLEIIESWRNGDLHRKAEGAESAAQLQTRLERFLDLLKTRKETNLLLCSHGRTIRAFNCLLLGMPLLAMDEFDHSNTGLYLFEREGEQFTLIKKNDISHLKMHLES